MRVYICMKRREVKTKHTNTCIRTHSIQKHRKKLKKWNLILFKWSITSLVCISAECIFDNYSSSCEWVSEWIKSCCCCWFFLLNCIWKLNFKWRREKCQFQWDENKTSEKESVNMNACVCVSEKESVNRVKQIETNMKIEMEFKLKLQCTEDLVSNENSNTQTTTADNIITFRFTEKSSQK